MNLPIKQHYIPVWLQNNFIENYNPNGQIWVHDLKTGKSFKQAPRRVGYEENLYTLDQPHEDPKELYAIDKLGNDTIDGMGATIVHDIRKSNKLPESNDDLARLIMVVAWQAARVPATMDTIVNSVKSVEQAFIEELRTNDEHFNNAKAHFIKDGGRGFEKDLLQNFSFETFQKAIAPENIQLNIPKNYVLERFLTFVERLIELFAQRKWRLLLSKGQDRFILGDNPVLTIGNSSPGHFASADAMILMPITQRMAIVGVSDDRFGFKEVQELPRTKVALINKATIGNAKRFLFSTERNFFWVNDKNTVEDSESAFKWRKIEEEKAASVGRSLHTRELPKKSWEELSQMTKLKMRRDKG